MASVLSNLGLKAFWCEAGKLSALSGTSPRGSHNLVNLELCLDIR